MLAEPGDIKSCEVVASGPTSVVLVGPKARAVRSVLTQYVLHSQPAQVAHVDRRAALRGSHVVDAHLPVRLVVANLLGREVGGREGGREVRATGERRPLHHL